MNKTKPYPDVEPNPNFAELSNKVLEFWQQQKVFEKSVENRSKDNEFIFFDGPPFANGLPHYGHLLTGFVKDIVARYQTLKGKRVERRFGWDCHGLPAEMEIEKSLGISGRAKIIEYGIDKFNEHCRESVLKYTKEWENYITKQARWVDFKNSYRTMDVGYMESSIWVFKQLYDQGLVYQSDRVLPYSWACQTPLSNFETRMDNSYRKIADKAITVKFALKTPPHGAPNGCEAYYLLAWTTTPWTLPSNLALAVAEDMEYSCVVVNNECLILGSSAVEKYKKELLLPPPSSRSREADVAIQNGKVQSLDCFAPARNDGVDVAHKTITGKDLVGISYTPLFNYFQNHPKSFKVLAAEFVVEGDGTGVVHCAPGFGEDDQILCKEHGIELVCPVDDAGKFTSEIPDFEGLQVFEANDGIIIKLKEQGNWLKTEQYLHNYPHCWRTDTPLIYKAVSSWYIEVTKIKDKLLRANQKTNWIPEHIKEGLFGKWLENVRDWSISRNRFWGTPIPIWTSDDPKYPRIDVYGSIAELEKDFGVKVADLHRPYIDELTRPNPDDPTGKSIMKRVNDVFDCWFESGAMPYGQIHYPFENKERLDVHPSADFIVEYTAQTRGWFYTLTVLAAALFDRPAFLNCICHGVILDTAGQKLSKRLKNYPDPMEIFEKYGSDAMRFVMSSSSVMRGQELCIDKDGKMFVDAIRLVLKPIWNAYNFFTLYANSDLIKAKLIYDSFNLNDKYILSKLKIAVETIDSGLDTYDLPTSCKAVEDFFEALNNWYIRRNRSRFWKSDKDQDKQAAYDTLYTVLHTMCIAASPLLPLLTEYIFLGLVEHGKFVADSSVHLQNYPDSSKFIYDSQLVDDIDKVRAICTAALHIRNTHNIRIRQPLSKLTVVGEGFGKLEQYLDLIKDELNVKEVTLSNEVSKYAKFNLKINFKQVSSRLSHKMKDLIADTKTSKWQKAPNGNVLICGEELEPGEFTLAFEPIVDSPAEAIGAGEGLAILDVAISSELELEGLARDVVRMIQQARKTAGLHVSDRIVVDIDADEKLTKACQVHEIYIKEQVLAHNINYGNLEGDYILREEHQIEGGKVIFGLIKATS